MKNISCSTTPNNCLTTIRASCVIYDGPSTINIGYTPNMNLKDLLLLIDSKFSGFSSGTFINSSSTINVSGLGTDDNPYIPTVVISPNANNSLVSVGNGLYVPPISSTQDLQQTTGFGNTTTDAITVIGSGNLANNGYGLHLMAIPGDGISTFGNGFIRVGNPVLSAVNAQGTLALAAAQITLRGVGSTTISLSSGGSIQLQANGVGSFFNIFSDNTFDLNCPVTRLVSGTSTLISSGSTLAFGGFLGGSLPYAEFRSNVAVPSSRLRVKGANAIDADDFVTKAQIDIFDLELVTSIGNTTDYGLSVLEDVGGLIRTNDGANWYIDNTSTMYLEKVVSAGITSAMLFLPSGDINFWPGNFNSITMYGDGSGRVKGGDAVNPDEFVTLGQIAPLAESLIEPFSIAGSAITLSYMNTNYGTLPIGATVTFTNLSDDPTVILIVNKYAVNSWAATTATKLV